MPIPSGWPAVYAYTLLVQADLSGTPFGGAPTWTDITRFVRLPDSIGITSWRQDALATVEPSTMGLTLDNSQITGDPVAPNGGRFTPGLATSPWSGRILPGVRFRVTVTMGAGTPVPLFDGYATDWDASYNADGSFTTCKVNCVDILAWLGNVQALRALHDEEVLTDHPAAYYPLDEPAGSTSAVDVSGNNRTAGLILAGKGAAANAVVFGFDVAGGAEAMTGLRMTRSAASKGSVVRLPAAASPSPSGTGCAWRVLFATTDNNPPNGGPGFFLQSVPGQAGGSVASYFTLGTDTAGRATVSVGRSPSVSFLDTAIGGAFTMPVVGDGALHELVVSVAADQRTTTLWIDGVLVGTAVAGSAMTFPAGTQIDLGGYVDATQTNVFPGTATFLCVSTYNTTLSAGRVATLHSALKTALAGESTDARVSRLLSYRTNLGAVLDAGVGTVGLQALAGVSPTQALLDVARAEGGVVYADGQGRIVLLNRTRLRNPSAFVTLDTERDLTVDYDARVDMQQLLNDVTYNRPGGGGQRVVDAASQAANGVRTDNRTLIVNSDQDALNAAGWQVANFKAAKVRTPNLVCDLLTQSDPATAEAILNLAPLKRVPLTNLPATAPATDVFVQGRSITITHDSFTAGFFTGQLPRPTLRFDAVADAFTKLDSGAVFAW